MIREFHTRLFQYTDYERVRKMRLRDADVQEICVVNGAPATPEVASELIARDCIIYPNTYLGFCDGELFTVFGVVPTSVPTVGTVWGVGTHLITKGGLDMITWGMNLVQLLSQHAPILENWIDTRNTAHMRWLEAMKFTFTGLTININGQPFTHFARVFKGV